MDLPELHGIITPLVTPLKADGSVDEAALTKLVEFQIRAGVRGLWVLGTTGRFDLLTDAAQRRVVEVVASSAAGRVALVLNISDMGTARTLEKVARFDDLPIDYYAALPPWYQPMTATEIHQYFSTLADRVSRPLVVYNVPWVCNQLSFPVLRQLAEHPRIVGSKDVNIGLTRMIDWPVAERRRMNFSYLHGNDQLAISTELGSDGFVTALSNVMPELAVAIWESVKAGDFGRAFGHQAHLSRIAQVMGFGPMLACLEVLLRHRGFADKILPAPLLSLDTETARRIEDVAEMVGLEPKG